MRCSGPVITACGAFLISCLIWSGLIALTITMLFGLSLASGWKLFACFMFFGCVAMAVLIYEIRNAIELPPDFDIDPPGRMGRRSPRRWNGRMHSFSFFA